MSKINTKTLVEQEKDLFLKFLDFLIQKSQLK